MKSTRCKSKVCFSLKNIAKRYNCLIDVATIYSSDMILRLHEFGCNIILQQVQEVGNTDAATNVDFSSLLGVRMSCEYRPVKFTKKPLTNLSVASYR